MRPTLQTGQVLSFSAENGNKYDKHAVVIKIGNAIVGRVDGAFSESARRMLADAVKLSVSIEATFVDLEQVMAVSRWGREYMDTQPIIRLTFSINDDLASPHCVTKALASAAIRWDGFRLCPMTNFRLAAIQGDHTLAITTGSSDEEQSNTGVSSDELSDTDNEHNDARRRHVYAPIRAEHVERGRRHDEAFGSNENQSPSQRLRRV